MGRIRWVMVAATLAAGSGLVGTGCEDKLDEKECDALRVAAFEVVNDAHNCGADADCKATKWPGCEKAINATNFDKVAGLHDKFTQGKCEEPAADCRDAPEVYCKQGLCTFREAGEDEDVTNPVDVQ